MYFQFEFKPCKNQGNTPPFGEVVHLGPAIWRGRPSRAMFPALIQVIPLSLSVSSAIASLCISLSSVLYILLKEHGHP